MKRLLIAGLSLALSSSVFANDKTETEKDFFGDNANEITMGFTLACNPQNGDAVYIDIDFSGIYNPERMEKFKVFHIIKKKLYPRAKQYKFSQTESLQYTYSWMGFSRNAKTMIGTLRLYRGEHHQADMPQEDKLKRLQQQEWKYIEITEDGPHINTHCSTVQLREAGENPIRVR